MTSADEAQDGVRGVQSDRIELARAAECYVGAPFRSNGCDPIAGFDCLGLVLAALADVGRSVRVPGRRALRTPHPQRLLRLPEQAGLVEAIGQLEPGDVLLFEPGPAQLHLGVAAPGGSLVHAHAGLRRVVRTPFPLPWPIVRQWRLA